MQLQKVHYSIQNAVANWIDPQIKESHESKLKYVCTNAPQVARVLNGLPEIPVIQAAATEIYSLDEGFVLGYEGDVILSDQERRLLYGNMRYIKTALEGMLSMCETLGFADNADGFSVKIPPNLTLGDFSKCAKDLDVTFSQCPILKRNDGQIKFCGVDKGSTWLVFTIVGATVGATCILKNIAELVDKIIAIRSHRITYRQQEEELRKAGIANDYLNDLVLVHNEILKGLQEKTIEALCDSHSVTDPEEKERVRYSLDLLGNWMDKGMEIYASIDSPQEIKAAFPAIESQTLPDGILKMLEAPKDSE